MKILVNKYEQNDHADIRFCHNGGGYFQPLLLIDSTVDGGDWRAAISDKSCGEFGSEVSVDIERGGRIFSCYYGSRVESDDDQWSNIEYDTCQDILEIFSKYLGYHPPVKGERCREDIKSGNIDFDAEVNDRHLDEDSYDGGWVIDTDQEGEYNNPYFPWSCDDDDDDYDEEDDDDYYDDYDEEDDESSAE